MINNDERNFLVELKILFKKYQVSIEDEIADDGYPNYITYIQNYTPDFHINIPLLELNTYLENLNE